MKKNLFFTSLVSFLSTIVLLLVLFFLNKVIEWNMLIVANSLGLLILTWYLLKKLKTTSASGVLIVASVALGRYIFILDWLIFGFEQRWGTLPLELLDLLAILLGALCYRKDRPWTWIAAIALIVACHLLYQNEIIPCMGK